MKCWHAVIVLLLSSAFNQIFAAEKLYVALEGEGKIAVIDTHTAQILTTIDLAEHAAAAHTPYSPHNVQVAPDGRSVWVTAMAGGHASVSGHDEHAGSVPAEQVIVIDPLTDTLGKRIPIAAGIHLAHVVLTPDSRYALVTAQDESAVYKIDAREYRVERRIPLPAHSQPHGLRVSPDGGYAYIALLAGNGMVVLDLATDKAVVKPLAGAAVQTAIAPSGSLVFASLYDSRQVAVFNPHSRTTGYINLPAGSKGPVQLYPTPDSRYLLVADQGYYFQQPAGNLVYKLNINSGAVVAAIPAGNAPHGVVVSARSNLAYITNLLSDDVSVIDTQSDKEIKRISVGSKPNGISLWSSESGGTP